MRDIKSEDFKEKIKELCEYNVVFSIVCVNKTDERFFTITNIEDEEELVYIYVESLSNSSHFLELMKKAIVITELKKKIRELEKQKPEQN